jgi:hypothetical protein
VTVTRSPDGATFNSGAAAAAIEKPSQHTHPHPEAKNFAGWDILLIFTYFDRRTTVFSRTKTCDDERRRR